MHTLCWVKSVGEGTKLAYEAEREIRYEEPGCPRNSRAVVQQGSFEGWEQGPNPLSPLPGATWSLSLVLPADVVPTPCKWSALCCFQYILAHSSRVASPEVPATVKIKTSAPPSHFQISGREHMIGLLGPGTQIPGSLCHVSRSTMLLRVIYIQLQGTFGSPESQV